MAKMTGLNWQPMRMPDDVDLHPDYPSKPSPGPDSGGGMSPLVTFALTGIMLCAVALLIGFVVIGLALLGWI